ncbi:ATP-binding protein [bacterium]|nr:ATP-binding protein [bacterium]
MSNNHGRAIRGGDATRRKGRLEPPAGAAPPVRERGGGARPEAHRAVAFRVGTARGQDPQIARRGTAAAQGAAAALRADRRQLRGAFGQRALGRELILRHSKRVLFRPAFKLVGQLLAAKRDLRLEQELKKLDRFDVLILDDIGYVQQSREEMEVLFTLLAERYERRSLLISSNLVFSQWDQIFKDPMTTMAAIDRLVHHAIILEFDGPPS